jgi:drug/metabolite transporter (DMT)-like permease
LGSIYIIWGSTYLAIRYVVATLPPFLMAAIRFALAGAVLYLWRRLSGEPNPRPREWRAAGIVGLCLLGLGNGSVVWAEQTVPSGPTSLIVATVPLWMILVDWLRPRGRKPALLALVGVLIGFGGVILLIGPGQLAGVDRIDPAGALVLTLGALGWSAGSIYARSAALPTSPLMGVSLEMLVGSAGLFVLGLLNGDLHRLNLAASAPSSWLGLAYLIVVGSWIAYSAYAWLLRNAPTPLVSTYAYVNPLVALLLGHFIAGESISTRAIIAALVIIGSVVLSTRGRFRRIRLPEESQA